MTAPFRTTRRVEFVDTDMAGIAHFTSFFRWMESAETEYLRTRGVTVNFPKDSERYGFPRVHASCDYLRPVKFEDVVEIEVGIENLGRKSITYSHEFRHNGAVVARGRITAVFIRELADHAIESVEIPDWLREKLLP